MKKSQLEVFLPRLFTQENYNQIIRIVSGILLLLVFFLPVSYAQTEGNPLFIDQDAAYYEQKKNQTSGLKSSPPVININRDQESNRQAGKNNTASRLSGASATQLVGCLIPADGSYSDFPGNDDGSIGPIVLPFSFDLYGTSYTSCYINNNGNITFTAPNGAYSASGFPFAGEPMVAAFWGDVDTRCGATVKYKVNATSLIVTWPGVGVYDANCTILNTFQLIITNGLDPLIGIGNNVAFYYGDMQWTTGTASGGGPDGFGGTPATVGINHGNGVDYVQVGRFDSNTGFYDGGGGSPDGVNYLDYQCITFNVGNAVNIPPSFSGFPPGNTLNIGCGETVNLTIQSLGPEVAQTVSTVVNTGGLCNVTHSTTDGLVSTTNMSITGAPCNTGTHIITFTATDNGSPGETTIASLTVNIADQTPLVITCPANISVSNDVGVCGAAVSYTVTSSGGCTGETLEQDAGLPSGSIFPVGNTTNTFTVTDGSALSASCSFLVTVTDNTPPAIACPADVTINNTPGLCTGKTTLDVPTVNVNCSPVGNALNFDGIDDYVRIGNVASLDFERTDAFTIEAWAKSSAQGIQMLYSKMYDAWPYTGYELYSYEGNVSVYLLNTYITNCIYVRTYDAPLADGNWHHIAATYSGNNDASGVKIYIDGILQVNEVVYNNLTSSIRTTAPAQLGTRYPGVDYWNGTLDEVRVWSTERTQSEIQSNMYSELNAQPGLVALYHFNQGVANNANPGLSTATDASGSGLNGTLYYFALTGTTSNWVCSKFGCVTNNVPETFPVGNTIVTWTATDAVGNRAICTQTVTVIDSEAPGISCPANITVSNDAGSCGASVNYAVPVGTDNCTGATTMQTTGQASDTNFPPGTTTNTFVVTDANNNTAACSFTVTVNDTEAPEAICQDVTVHLDATGHGSITALDVNSGSKDNCGISGQCGIEPPDVTCTPGFVLSQVDFDCGDLGANPVVLTINDIHGNNSTCNATVYVESILAPDARCKNIVVDLNASGTASIAAADVYNESDDACGIAGMTVVPSAFNCTNVGNNTVTLTVTDVHGNVSACEALVTVTGGPLYQYVLVAGEEVHIHQSNVLSGGIGITTASGKAVFHENTQVTSPGTFVESPNIEIASGSAVTTQINAVASVPIPSFEINPYTSNNDITVPAGSTLTLTDSIYNKVKVEKYGTVIFTQPVVNIRHLDAKEFTVIRFAQCTKVRMKEHMHIKRNSQFNPDGLGVMVFAQKHVDVKEGSRVFATLYAKDEHIHAKGKAANRTKMTGLFIAKKIHKGEYVDWSANTQCGRCSVSPALFARVKASSDVACDGAGNGSLTVSVTGGTGPYTIEWNTVPPQYGPTAGSLAPGSYVATVTDALGAVTTVNADVIVETYTILATDEVNIGKHDTVFSGSVGIIKVSGKATLDASAIVHDDAILIAPVINLPGGSTATDTVYGIAPAWPTPFEGNILYSSSSDLIVPNGTTFTMAGADTLRRKIVVGENATLVVTAASLNIADNLELKKNAKLVFQSPCSKVRIKRDLKADDNLTINAAGRQVAFHVNGNVTVNKGANVIATIIAPNGTIATQNATGAAPSRMTGKFYAKRVLGGDYTYWNESTACPCTAPLPLVANSPAPNAMPVIPVTADSDASKTITGELAVKAYPNPFRDQVTIAFSSPVTDKVRLVVLNPAGEEVEELYDGPVDAGMQYEFRFNAMNFMSSGVYFYRIQTGSGQYAIDKMIFVK